MRALLLLGLAVLTQTQRAAGQQRPLATFAWHGLNVVVLADSVLGVIIVSTSPTGEVQKRIYRQAPQVVRYWLDSIPPNRELEGGTPVTTLGDDDLVGIRASGVGKFEVIFGGAKDHPYATVVNRTQLIAFTEAVGRAAAAGGWDSSGPVPQSHDPLGTVYWISRNGVNLQGPRPDNIPPPEYPRYQQEHGVPGDVLLRYTIGPNGSVEPGSLAVPWATDSAFGAAAARAIMQGRFHPGTMKGAAVRTGVLQVVSFRIGR